MYERTLRELGLLSLERRQHTEASYHCLELPKWKMQRAEPGEICFNISVKTVRSSLRKLAILSTELDDIIAT